MKRRTVIKTLAAGLPVAWMTNPFDHNSFVANMHTNEALVKGPFEACWDSLKQYEVPEWFRDARLGICSDDYK